MNLIYEDDIDKQSFGLCDISFSAGNTLTSAVLMSIFSWRRGASNEIDDAGNRYGWWADTPQRKLGSKFWLLRRTSITPVILQKAKEYCQEALSWMIEDGLCKAITVDAKQNQKQPDGIQVLIRMYKNDGTTQTETFENLWQELN